MSQYNNRMYDVRTREYEDFIYDELRANIHHLAEVRREISPQLANITIRCLDEDIVNIADHIATLYQKNALYTDEILSAVRSIVDEILIEGENILRASQRQRRDSRSGGSSRQNYYRNDHSSNSTKHGFRGSSGYGANRNSQNDQNMSYDDRVRADRASKATAASNRNNDEIYAMSRNKQSKSNIKDTTPNVDIAGVVVKADYAVIGSVCEIDASIKSIDSEENLSSPANKVYRLESKAIYRSHENDIVSKRVYTVCSPVTKPEHAWNIIKYEDPTILNPDNYLYVVGYNRLTVGRTSPGMGVELLKYMPLIRTIVSTRATQEDNIASNKLTDIVKVLSDAPVWVRDVYRARILNAWNYFASCNFTNNLNPALSLTFKDFNELLKMFAFNNGDESKGFMVLGNHINNQETVKRINSSMLNILRCILGSNNGFIDVRSDNLQYLSAFDEIPIAISGAKRSRDIGSMTDDEKLEYAQAFCKDYCCASAKQYMVVTNMDVSKIKVHSTVNLVTATDNFLTNLLKDELASGVQRCEALMSVTNGWKYVSHIGIRNNELILIQRNEYL